jgi:hypothetical protein
MIMDYKKLREIRGKTKAQWWGGENGMREGKIGIRKTGKERKVQKTSKKKVTMKRQKEVKEPQPPDSQGLRAATIRPEPMEVYK